MKKTILTLNAMGLLLFFLGCKEKTSISYYRHLDYSGIHNVKLKYPFTPDTTKQEYCFKIARDNSGRITMIRFPDVGGCGLDPRDKYKYIKITYSKDHEIWRYYDEKKHPAMTSDGVYGEDFKLDRRGYPVSIICLDSLEKPIEDVWSIATYLLTTDHRGLVTEWMRLNLKGDTVADCNGNYRTRFKYNDNEFLVEQANYDENYSLAALSDSVAIIRYKYSENNDIIEESYFDADGKLKARDDDIAAILKYKYDDTGALIEVSAFDETGMPAPQWDMNSCIKKIQRYENGYASEIALYSEDQVPRRIEKYNCFGNLIDDKFFDNEGNLMMDSTRNYAAYSGEYSSDGYIIEENFYDDNKRLTVSNDYGFARAVYLRDEKNNLVRLSYYNEKNELFESPRFQYTFVTYNYDYGRNAITETYRDRRGFPKKCNYGYAVKTSYYDKDWNLTDSKFFDEAGNLVITSKFDKDGEMIP